METAPQDFATHRRWVPAYHFLLALIVVSNVVWQVIQVVRHFSWNGIFNVLIAIGLLLAAYFARAFPAANQDRIIRLEERLRLERLLPPDMKGRIPEFTTR